MNENIDLTKILKDCPKGWKFYSSVYGEVEFKTLEFKRLRYRFDYDTWHLQEPAYEEDPYPIKFYAQNTAYCVSKAGEHIKGKGECTFFPSKDQRDWSKFSAPWYKKEKFDPKTLKPFDKVLSKYDGGCWSANLFSHIEEDNEYYSNFSFACNGALVRFCIPYNDETKHLVGTTAEAPEYYKYWED